MRRTAVGFFTKHLNALGFGLAIISVGVVLVVGVASTYSVVDDIAWVDHTHLVMESIENLGRALAEATNARRGSSCALLDSPQPSSTAVSVVSSSGRLALRSRASFYSYFGRIRRDQLMPKTILLVEDTPCDEKLGVLALKKTVMNMQTAMARAYRFATDEHKDRDSREDIAQCYRLGTNAYVRKPIDFAEFVRAATTIAHFWLVMNERSPAMGQS